MSRLKRLLRYLPKAVFDTSPAAVIALRIGAEGGLTWRVYEQTLTVNAFDATFLFDLRERTISELAIDLSAIGVVTSYIDAYQAHVGSISLLESEGDQDDAIELQTNPLWSLYGAYDQQLKTAEADAGNAIAQIVIPDASDYWLDVWGGLYGVPRAQSEEDPSLAARIPAEAFRLRVNPLAIELAIRDLTGKDVRIEEPWQSVARWDHSLLDGPDRFYDGVRIGYHLIQPTSTDSVDWGEIMPIVERNRPSGVLVLAPVTRLSFEIDATGHTVLFGVFSLNAAETPYEDSLLWDYSEFGEVSIPNRSAFRGREILRSSQSLYSDIGYNFEFSADRDFRVFYLDVTYQRMSWRTQATWGQTGVTWSTADYVANAGITRTS